MTKYTDNLQRIPLEAQHIASGANMDAFGSWFMPIQYAKGILQEHLHTRKYVSLFDCSHMGEFRLQGKKVSQDLDWLFPRKVSNQKIGSCRYNFFLTQEGSVIDDLLVYRIAENEFYLVVNGATIDKDRMHIQRFLSPSTTLIDESSETVKLDIQGPHALRLLESCGFYSASLLSYYHFTNQEVQGIPCCISRTGYTGELGFELYTSVDHGEGLWRLLLSKKNNLELAGLGARNTLRLEMGYPLYGHELDIETTPIEAGFGKMLTKNHPCIGRETLEAPPKKKLVGIRFAGRRAVRDGALVVNTQKKAIGTITSGSFSPSLQCGIALAYISPNEEHSTVFGKLNKTYIPGRIENLPFYCNGTARTPFRSNASRTAKRYSGELRKHD